MLTTFFDVLRRHKIPVTITEHLDLLKGLNSPDIFADRDAFYYYARCVLVKDEKYYDRFDQAFSAFFEGLESVEGLIDAFIPEDWLKSEFIKTLSDEDKAKIDSVDSLEKLIDEFKKRLEEQKEKHTGGSKWIGTGGTSPFGHSGYNPSGIRVGGKSKNKRATKVWETRQFKNYDESESISARNIHVALRRLRKFARTGAEDQLDIDDTIRSTALNAGYLDLKLVRERHNAVKVLVLFDVGGSMDIYVKETEQLFNAVRTEFKHLEYFYFHNFIYESVWKDNRRRTDERTPLIEVLRTFGKDYKVIFVGDAAMSPYEITHSGGSVEHWNKASGAYHAQELLNHFDKVAWINPEPKSHWHYTASTEIIQKLFQNKMYPLSIEGLEHCMSYLSK